MPEFDVAYEAARSLRRIRPLILQRIRASCTSRFGVERWIETVDERLAAHWPRFFGLLHRLYGHHYDFFYYLASITLTAVRCTSTCSPATSSGCAARSRISKSWG